MPSPEIKQEPSDGRTSADAPKSNTARVVPSSSLATQEPGSTQTPFPNRLICVADDGHRKFNFLTSFPTDRVGEEERRWVEFVHPKSPTPFDTSYC